MPPAALSVLVGSAALPSPESPAAATLLSASASALATARRLEDAPERFSPILKVGVILAVVVLSIGLLVWREMAESDPAHAAPASPRRSPEPRSAPRSAAGAVREVRFADELAEEPSPPARSRAGDAPSRATGAEIAEAALAAAAAPTVELTAADERPLALAVSSSSSRRQAGQRPTRHTRLAESSAGDAEPEGRVVDPDYTV